MSDGSAPKAPSAEEMEFGFAGLEAAAAAAPAVEAAPAPSVRWLDGKKRVESYPLEFPFELDGVEHRVVTIKRLSAREVAAFIEKMRGGGKSNLHWPMYFVGTAEVSAAAWDEMDDDDRLKLSEIADAFLPARFRAA